MTSTDFGGGQRSCGVKGPVLVTQTSSVFTRAPLEDFVPHIISCSCTVHVLYSCWLACWKYSKLCLVFFWTLEDTRLFSMCVIHYSLFVFYLHRFEVPQVVPYSAHQLQPVPVSPVSTGPFNYSCPLVTSFSSSVATLTQFPVNLQSPPPVHPPLVYLQQPVQPQPASLIAPSNPASSSTETPHSYQCSPPQLTIGVSMATATGFQGNPVGIKEASPNLLPDSSQPLCGTLAASPQTALSPPVNPYYELQAVGEQLTLQGVPKSTSRGFPLPLTPYGIIDRRFQQSSSVGDTLPDGSKKEFMITRAEKVSLWR